MIHATLFRDAVFNKFFEIMLAIVITTAIFVFSNLLYKIATSICKEL